MVHILSQEFKTFQCLTYALPGQPREITPNDLLLIYLTLPLPPTQHFPGSQPDQLFHAFFTIATTLSNGLGEWTSLYRRFMLSADFQKKLDISCVDKVHYGQ